MNFQEQLPVLLVVIPLLSVIVVNIAGFFNKRLCYPLTVIVMAATSACALGLLLQLMEDGPINYRLGGWPPPVGINFVIDHLNGLILVVIAIVGFVAAVYSGRGVAEELPEKITSFYTLYILLVSGLLGMTVTGDTFNLYVLVEISALTGYALIALGLDRALLASFNYIIMGTVGASLYLLGIGHLYIMTGSLNMADLLRILPDLYSSRAILVAFVLILIGLWAKMAFFPFHGWLPNAYTYAPSATSTVVAPLMTKVSIYVMVRMMFSVFSADYSFDILPFKGVIVWMSVAAIVAGSLMALSQTDFKKMLSYLIIAEVGYMVGGVWLANRLGITGAILHIVNDALMTLCLFLVAGIVVYKTGGHRLDDLRGLYKKMPFTMTAFTAVALSMIGVPPTVGFFSKWYMVLGAVEAGQWHFLAALIFSSLINAVLFFRVIEIAYFGTTSEQPGHGRLTTKIDEAPASMLVPVLAVSVSLIVVGVYTGEIVNHVIRFAVPGGM